MSNHSADRQHTNLAGRDRAREPDAANTEAPPPFFASLRRFAGARSKAIRRCELCGKEIGELHPHLLVMNVRDVACSCEECAILFSGQTAGNYRRIPIDALWLADFQLSDALWDALGIPIGMAYFSVPEGSTTARAFYPSPAGAMESLLSLEAWQDIAKSSPEVQKMEAEVEALLVNRLSDTRECFIVSIDECYRLVGLIRSKWHGFSGGEEVWDAIGEFFTTLKRRAVRIEDAAAATRREAKSAAGAKVGEGA